MALLKYTYQMSDDGTHYEPRILFGSTQNEATTCEGCGENKGGTFWYDAAYESSMASTPGICDDCQTLCTSDQPAYYTDVRRPDYPVQGLTNEHATYVVDTVLRQWLAAALSE